jgi:hypothetical protein
MSEWNPPSLKPTDSLIYQFDGLSLMPDVKDVGSDHMWEMEISNIDPMPPTVGNPELKDPGLQEETRPKRNARQTTTPGAAQPVHQIRATKSAASTKSTKT